MFKRRLLTQALERLIGDETGKAVGVARVPYTLNGQAPAFPYVIIFPMRRGLLYGPPMSDNPWSLVEAPYQFKCVGATDEQAEWMADKVREVILGRDAFGGLLNTISLDGAAVIDRRPDGISPGPLSVDGTMFSVDDEYVFVVETDVESED